MLLNEVTNIVTSDKKPAQLKLRAQIQSGNEL